jgi:3-ketosteroid 9alpha-monooxygenase subunit A
MSTTPELAVRGIDHGTPPSRFARGWHCLGLADGFRDGKPHPVDAFGTKLVVFADTAGALHVLDGYCRHMGGDLTQGTVKGDQVACPFHDWRWGGDGRCKAIPYARRVPMRARTRSWVTCEQNGQLFVWHDEEGNPPIPEQAIPEIPGIGDNQWSPWSWKSLLIEGANCRELMDNNTDMAHFFYVHFAYPTKFVNVFEGHTASQFMESKARPDVHQSDKYDIDAALLRSSATYYGPAYQIDYLENDFGNGFSVESVLVNCHIPVRQDAFLLQWAVAVKRIEGMSDSQTTDMASKFATHFGEGFEQDVAIWQSKVPVQNPLLCEEDGPVYQHRRWYDQFYVDVADIEPEMTNRFEFEVDTSRANEVWQAEVAENLRVQTTGAGR